MGKVADKGGFLAVLSEAGIHTEIFPLLIFIGVGAFALDSAAGVLLGKIMCAVSKGKVNPMIGAYGISAFPMPSRVVQKLGLQFNPHNHLLMHAAGANTAGQIASVVAGGVMLMLIPLFA